MKMSAKELVERCVSKDHSAWAEFIRLYEGLVQKSIRYKIKKMEAYFVYSEARDIAQEVFLKLWEKDQLAGLRNVGCLKSWLVTVSINRTSDYCRKRFKEVAKLRPLQEV